MECKLSNPTKYVYIHLNWCLINKLLSILLVKMFQLELVFFKLAINHDNKIFDKWSFEYYSKFVFFLNHWNFELLLVYMDEIEKREKKVAQIKEVIYTFMYLCVQLLGRKYWLGLFERLGFGVCKFF